MNEHFEDFFLPQGEIAETPNIDQIIKNLNSSVAKNCDDATLYSYLAMAYFEKFDKLTTDDFENEGLKNVYDLIIINAEKAIEIDPKQTEAYLMCIKAYNIGFIWGYISADEYITNSMALFSKAIENNKEKEHLYYYEMGNFYDINGNAGLIEFNRAFELSLENYNRALTIKPDFVDAYLARGDAFYEKSLFYLNLAYDSYRTVLSFDPDNVKVKSRIKIPG